MFRAVPTFFLLKLHNVKLTVMIKDAFLLNALRYVLVQVEQWQCSSHRHHCHVEIV